MSVDRVIQIAVTSSGAVVAVAAMMREPLWDETQCGSSLVFRQFERKLKACG